MHFDILPFCPIFAPKIVFSFICTFNAGHDMQNILSRLKRMSALKPKILETHGEIDKKTMKNYVKDSSVFEKKHSTRRFELHFIFNENANLSQNRIFEHI